MSLLSFSPQPSNPLYHYRIPRRPALLAWTTSLEDENIASTVGTLATAATRAQAAAHTAFDAVHRFDTEIIVARLPSQPSKVVTAECAVPLDAP